ncbi:MAG: RNA polymerase-associated protein RapA [Chlamydiia bacterium]|nr:RNA polymerase-associated protein RapA [Chlamydiia bacterium]
MLNLRKLRQDFSSNILREGKSLYDDKKVILAKILHLDAKTLRISGKVLGQFNNTYESEIEIDRQECETIDSDCDCPYHYDCQHLAALLYYLEENLDEILVTFSNENDLEEDAEIDHEEKKEILEAVKEAASKEEIRKEEQYQRQLIQEYVQASKILAKSPFFLPVEKHDVDKAELAIVFSQKHKQGKAAIEFQLAFRLPSRSKPLHIPYLKRLLEAMRHEEPIYIGGKKYHFSLESFSEDQKILVQMIQDYTRFLEKPSSERAYKVGYIDLKIFGTILAKAYEIASDNLMKKKGSFQDEDFATLPCLYEEGLESPLKFSLRSAGVSINLEYINPPVSKILLDPKILLDETAIMLEDVCLFECAKPGMLFESVYYRFADDITRQHLLGLHQLRDLTIPEPLFGSFVENALPEMSRYAQVSDEEVINSFVTLPYTGDIEAVCNLSYLNGELDASLLFNYEKKQVPAIASQLKFEDVDGFVKKEGIVARNLVEERKLVEELFQDFIFDQDQGIFIAKTEKKIIEFMTDIIPRYQDRVKFNCPQNLLDQFIYDETTFTLALSHTSRMDVYQIDLKVNGALKGIKLNRLWECFLSRRAFIELDIGRSSGGKDKNNKIPKILVLDLDRVGSVIKLFDELGIEALDNHVLERPLWSIANIDKSNFEGLPVKFSMTRRLMDIRKQMLGEKQFDFSDVPDQIHAELRKYQVEGVHWLERLRKMFLNGILADDMGLGKTLQAIVALTQFTSSGKKSTSLIVCPTSLLYNWKEEFSKFNPKLKVLVVDGIPNQRKKLIQSYKKYDVIVTSYSLLQKDIEHYDDHRFSYMILDEAQHIKNRGTRNAKSVKLVKAEHKVILSGTPIENSLEELWSLFDYLMPGFLSSYDRFIEKYIRVSGDEQKANMQYLRKKVAPFILRRMKSEVLEDLPPVSEIPYHCQLSETQHELYRSYAESARDELVKLVERDGFDKVQIHVLATLTRLKQICCHPAIFAKEVAEPGDSSKYDMLLELLQTLVEGNHKTVIFSQYTRMLQIMRRDFEQMGIKFVYLDGSSKNRLDIVNQFNDDKTISVFLVSLKAGGTGLNLVGADTVIHYDMWWNPAVENQATDRVHRIGQKQSVNVYKLITKGTIEEKIVDMQARKKGLVRKVVSCDDEAISKLTWEDVLELLQT